MARLILFDTSNFNDYPIGGQVTSIKNFLRFVGENYQNHLQDILLVGVTKDSQNLGKVLQINTAAGILNFVPVALAGQNLNKVKKSLRLEYLKGLYKYRKVIGINRQDCLYLHTPEAFAFTHVVAPKNVCFVFSHGSYFNTTGDVRFFKGSPVVLLAFKQLLMLVIKKATAIFVLDVETQNKYKKINPNTICVGNSIVCQDAIKTNAIDEKCPKLLFVGRLSRVKNIEPIIEATIEYEPDCRLKIIGAGELMDELRQKTNDRVEFVGAVPHDDVKKYMQKSDILIMNSIHEGIPMTILEGLSVGLPIVTTDVGGIGQVVDYGVDSEKTDGTVISIITAIKRIVSKYDFYSNNAFKNSFKFDYKVVNKEVFSVINKYLMW